MKSLGTLLKLATRQLEMLRRRLAAELARQRRIEAQLAEHEETLRAEQKLALLDQESALAFSAYSVRALLERRALEGELELAGGEIIKLRALLAEAHVEARKFERLIELEQVRQRAALEKRENDALDEYATMRRANRD